MGAGGTSDAIAGRVGASRMGGVVARRGLFERLGGPARVTVVSAPAGSGKTVLLRSWIGQTGLAERAEWVASEPDERAAVPEPDGRKQLQTAIHPAAARAAERE